MSKFYDNAELKNDILKCEHCYISFSEYCEPKFLPSFNTMCNKF